MNIKGAVALVTGGAHRVGKAIALSLAQEGANMIIHYNRSEEAARETVAAAMAFGVKALAIRADIADLAQVNNMIAQAAREIGPVDILVNSASQWKSTPFPSVSLAEWHSVFNTDFNGAFYCANAVVPQMLEKGGGLIINILDLSSVQPYYKMSAHGTAKAALLSLTHHLALELAPVVRVNAVCLGPVLPPVHLSAEEIAQVAAHTMLQRWGTPDDAVRAVHYLIGAGFVTSECLTVDGGARYAHRRFMADPGLDSANNSKNLQR